MKTPFEMAVSLLALLSACQDTCQNAAPVTISAVELHRAFLADSKVAEKRWRGKTLRITGLVAIAKARTIGRTATRDVEVPAQVYFKTELDHLPGDIKYVVCEGGFDVPQAGGGFALDPRIVVGRPLTIECRLARFRWSSPGLYLSNCQVAEP